MTDADTESAVSRPTTYLGGPMRGIDHYNFPLFELAAAALRDSGHEVVSPAEIDEAEGFVHVSRDADGKITGVMLTHKFTIERVLRRDYSEILRCDKVVLLPGWEESTGAQGERRLANECGINVFQLTLKELNGQMYPWLQHVPAAYHPPLRVVETADETPEQLSWLSLWKARNGSVDPAIAARNGEHREVDPVTGGMKGQKDIQLSLIPVGALEDLGRVYAMGAAKYERSNWRKGYAWHLCYDAAFRHLLASMRGEWLDPESGLPHVMHVAWHMMTLHTFERDGLGTNDIV